MSTKNLISCTFHLPILPFLVFLFSFFDKDRFENGHSNKFCNWPEKLSLGEKARLGVDSEHPPKQQASTKSFCIIGDRF